MLDKNILDDIENRIEQVRAENREMTIAEKDREYLYIQLQAIVVGSIKDLLAVPNMLSTEG